MIFPDHVIEFPAHGASCTLRRYQSTELKFNSAQEDLMGQTRQQRAGAELHRLTKQHMETHRTAEYRLALIEVAREHPDLVTAYSRPDEDDLERQQHEAGNEVDRRAKAYMEQSGEKDYRVAYRKVLDDAEPELRQRYVYGGD